MLLFLLCGAVRAFVFSSSGSLFASIVSFLLASALAFFCFFFEPPVSLCLALFSVSHFPARLKKTGVRGLGGLRRPSFVVSPSFAPPFLFLKKGEKECGEEIGGDFFISFYRRREGRRRAVRFLFCHRPLSLLSTQIDSTHKRRTRQVELERGEQRSRTVRNKLLA